MDVVNKTMLNQGVLLLFQLFEGPYHPQFLEGAVEEESVCLLLGYRKVSNGRGDPHLPELLEETPEHYGMVITWNRTSLLSGVYY